MTQDTTRWNHLLSTLRTRFGETLDLDGVLFLIGIQELGKGFQKLKKDQKLEVMHVAICRLLEPYGFYKFEGLDAEGWPHYERTGKLPRLNEQEQQSLMQEAILEYFDGEGLADENTG